MIGQYDRTMTIIFGPDPVGDAVVAALEALEAGEPVVERREVDLKEEAARRNPDGSIRPGSPRNESAARALAGECACMANTPGGGALIVGVADGGDLIGTDLDTEWLRARIYELTNRLLTVDARPAAVRGTRLLVLTMVEAMEPVRWKGKITWRVADRCVEMDSSTWHARRLQSMRVDWSAQSSNLTADEVRADAIEIVRDFLRASQDTSANDLAEVETPDLLRRLNAVTGSGHLTNAAALLFVGRETPGLDYIRRDVPGGDSTERVRRGGRPLIRELDEVFTAARAHNPLIHLRSGLVIGQERRIPDRTVREAIVNAVAHREWSVPEPSLVEHVGNQLRVTSPGGFYGGVTPTNIINHPSESRNTALTALLADVRIAEREGIGVDRMVADMLRFGYPLPDIRETGSPSVVLTLVADNVDAGWMSWLARFDDGRARSDLRWLMALHLLARRGWFDVASLARFLQVSAPESESVIGEIYSTSIGSIPVLAPVDGVPDSAESAWAITRAARSALDDEGAPHGARRRTPGRASIATTYARERGRISSTELGSLVGAAPSNVGPVLRTLEAEGILEPSRPNRRGAGFFYRPTAVGSAASE